MSLMEKRIDNILKAMRDAKDYEMKSIWNRKLQELFKIRERRAYERLEHKARMVH